jgi:hypothetical protein
MSATRRLDERDPAIDGRLVRGRGSAVFDRGEQPEENAIALKNASPMRCPRRVLSSGEDFCPNFCPW